MRVTQSLIARAAALVIATMSAACDSPLEPSPDLRGGIVATFQVSGEQFRVFVRNPTTIAQLIQLQQGFAIASIPNGRLRRGPGAGNHNAPFSWHLDPEDIQLAGFTMELCDGRPSYVEDHVDEYADVIGRYCPWGARLVRVDDYRD